MVPVQPQNMCNKKQARATKSEDQNVLRNKKLLISLNIHLNPQCCLGYGNRVIIRRPIFVHLPKLMCYTIMVLMLPCHALHYDIKDLK